ncbi:hypothetical protein KCU93_g3700, partial [Aureobasidium melanogenum]
MARVVTGKDTGIRVLVGANANDRTIDIVAIHGIGAHPDDTWCKLREADLDKTRPENYVNWLDDPDMLPSIAPNARVMRYGYESAWCEPEAILDARNDSNEWPGIFQSVTGLIFFGTPFRGAEGISQSEMLQAALSKYQDQVQTEVLQILDPGNELLQDLVDTFTKLRRALLRNNRYRDWMRQHPQKPSIYVRRYTPFHHLSWLRQKSRDLRTRAACPLGTDEEVSEGRDSVNWSKRFDMGEWPEMSPQEESIIAHGAIVERDLADHERSGIFRWSPEGEVFVRRRYSDFSASDWYSDDSDADEVGPPPNRTHLQEVPDPSDHAQQKDIYMEHRHGQDIELALGCHDQYFPPPTHPDMLQEMHGELHHGSAPMVPKRRLSLTTEFRDTAEGWKIPRLDLQHVQSFGGTPQITSGTEILSITDQDAYVPVSHSFREYSASSGLSNTVGVNWDQANVLPEVPPWSYEELNQGVMNQGMMDQVMMDQGMIDQDMMHEGIVNEWVANEGVANEGVANEGVANEGVVLEELNIEESLSRR